MKQKLKPGQINTPFVLFHIRDNGDWSSNPKLYLIAFASVDADIAAVAQSLFVCKIGMMLDNRNIMRRLSATLQEKPEELRSFAVADDLTTLGTSLIRELESSKVPNLCYHIMIIEKISWRFIGSQKLIDQQKTSEEIIKTLCGSTTYLYSYYLYLSAHKKEPPINSYFSLAGQEALCQKSKRAIDSLALTQEFGEAATIVDETTKKITAPLIADSFNTYVAIFMDKGGRVLMDRAEGEVHLADLLIDQALCCFLMSVCYAEKLLTVSQEQLASGHANCAFARQKFLRYCDGSEKEEYRQALLMDANYALKYYLSVNDQVMCFKLRRLISENSHCRSLGKFILDNATFFSNYPKIFRQTLRCQRSIAPGISKTGSSEEVLLDAEKIFCQFQKDPDTVKPAELVSSQVLLERVINETSDRDKELTRRCHCALVKIHYTFAMLANCEETAVDHLSSAKNHLPFAKLGTTEKSKALLDAVSFHMSGKALLRFEHQTSRAMSDLEKAYVIYKKQQAQKGMNAIAHLVPTASFHQAHVGNNNKGPK